MSKELEWFEKWFQEEYDILYPHRSESQAQTQVESLIKENLLSKEKPWIDLGCGAGRHLKFLQQHHISYGMDLSFFLLNKSALKNKVRGDLRFLPFREKAFSGVFSFFTSFGYFASLKDDLNVLKQYHHILDDKGILFLDLMNAQSVVKPLPNEDTTILKNGDEVLQKRYFKEGQVCKDIEWKISTGEIKKYSERVRIYTLDEMKKIISEVGFELIKVIGDEMGSDFDIEKSPRMSLILRKF